MTGERVGERDERRRKLEPIHVRWLHVSYLLLCSKLCSAKMARKNVTVALAVGNLDFGTTVT